MTGKSYSVETNTQKGAKSKGTVFVRNSNTCIRVPFDRLEEFLLQGWVRGRAAGATTHNTGKKFIYNPATGQQRLIPEVLVSQYLSEGWVLGRK